MTAIKKDMLLHQKCQKDFKNHLYTVFKYINLPHPTQIQYDIADVLQYRDENGLLPDTIIEGFRGVAKSTITGCYTSWRLDNDPENYQLIEVSANQAEAMKFLAFTRKLLDVVPHLNYLIPDTDKKGKNQRDNAFAFDVRPAILKQQPSCRAIGIFGQLTGNRATEIIADDIETSQNCETATTREKLRRAVTEFSPILRPQKGRLLYLGTPHTEESIYNEEVQKGCRLQIFPVRYPTPQECEKYGNNLAEALVKRMIDKPELVGQPTDPLRFDEETIIREEAKGRSKFQMQYMLDNTLSDLERYPLKCSDLVVIDTDKDIAPEKVAYGSSSNLILNDLPCYGLGADRFYTNIPIEGTKWLQYHLKLMAIDPSGRGRDELAVTIVGVLNGQLFVLKNVGMQGGYCEENLKKIAELAKEYNIHKCVIESNFGDGIFTALLTPILLKYHSCQIEEVRQSIQKEKRIIDTLEPVLNQHKLIFSKSVIKEDLEQIKIYPDEHKKDYSLIYQMTHLTKDRGCLSHDDKVDCLAIAVAACLELLKVDIDKKIQEREEEEFEAYLNSPLLFNNRYIDFEDDNKSWFNI